MRQTCLEMIYELAKKDERIFFIGSDLGHGTLAQFKAEVPRRFLMEGVSETNIIGMASGLALEGKIPYVNTIATFLTRRAFEQIAVDLCLQNVKVRLVASGGGLVYAPLGATHLAIEDLAILRSLPHMTILVPADALEMRRLMPLTVDHPGPIYIRLSKGNEPVITGDGYPIEIGKAVRFRDGSDALLVSTGITLQRSLEASSILAGQGIETTVLHMHTIKPMDQKTLIECAEEVSAIVTVEEHTLTGGLGSAVAEVLFEANFESPKYFRRIGIPDCFPDQYGSQESLLERYAITTDSIVTTINQLLERRRQKCPTSIL